MESKTPPPTPGRTSLALLVAIALTSFSALLLELALTRLFSVVLFYHFAFLAISVALLGLGAGGVFAYYLHIGMLPDSPVQTPEKLYQQRGFFAYLVVTTAVFVLLMFTSIPRMYTIFNVDPARTQPLWTLGRK